jgi:hypothetical protein
VVGIMEKKLNKLIGKIMILFTLIIGWTFVDRFLVVSDTIFCIILVGIIVIMMVLFGGEN